MNVILVVVDALRRDRLGLYGYYKCVSNTLDAHASHNIIFMNATGGHITWHGLARMLMSRDDYKLNAVNTELESPHLLEYLTNSHWFISNPLVAGIVGSSEVQPFTVIEDIIPLACNRIDNLDSSDEWFMMLWLMDVHEYYNYNMVTGEYSEGKFIMSGMEERNRVVEYYNAAYDYCVRHTCDHISKLIDHVVNTDTVVLITADHGEILGDRFGAYYQHHYAPVRELIDIPLIAIVPKAWRPKVPPLVSYRPVDLLDIAPTILHLLGIDIPEEFIGNILPVRIPDYDKDALHRLRALGYIK